MWWLHARVYREDILLKLYIIFILGLDNDLSEIGLVDLLARSRTDWCGHMQGVPRAQPDVYLDQAQPRPRLHDNLTSTTHLPCNGSHIVN